MRPRNMGQITYQVVHMVSVALQLTAVAATTWTMSGCSGSPSLLTPDKAERFSRTAFDHVIIGLSVACMFG